VVDKNLESLDGVRSVDDVRERASTAVLAAHLLRAVHAHHVTLNALADRKANFLLGATFISLSIMLTTDLREMTVTISLVTILSLIVAAFAVLSVIPHYKVKNDGLRENLFFFGSFAEREFDDFFDDVEDILQSEQKIRECFAHDIHTIGRILLKKKYFYLSWAYRVFLLELMITPISLLVEGGG